MTTKEKLEQQHIQGLVETALFNANKAESISNETKNEVGELSVEVENQTANSADTMMALDMVMSEEIPHINTVTDDLREAIDDILTNVIPEILGAL